MKWRGVAIRLAIVFIAYALLALAYNHVAGDRGLLSPSGTLDGRLLAFGGTLWFARTALIVFVPFTIVYRFTSAAANYCADYCAKRRAK